MGSEKLGGNYENRRGERDWKKERERDLTRKRRIGEVAVGMVAMTLIAAALAHSTKTSEIMNDEERAKNVKKIEAEGIVFHDGVNVRKEPFVNNTDPNQLADIDGKGESVVVDYDGEAYYYNNENDANGGWYGVEAEQLANVLFENSYISKMEANNLNSDEKYGDGIVWLNENYAEVFGPDEES